MNGNVNQPRTLIIGVIGSDTHIVGMKLLEYALQEAGFRVVPLGIMVSQEEFVRAAIETAADAVLVSSIYGHGEIDCRGIREKFVEAGLGSIPLFAGGNLVIGKQPWEETEKLFKNMGFDYVYPPGTPAEAPIKDLRELFRKQEAV